MSDLICQIYAPMPALIPATLIYDVYSIVIVECLHLKADYIRFLHLYESLFYYILRRERSALGQHGYVT
jgi:hypothetical protein